jgi:hypothetical protein
MISRFKRLGWLFAAVAALLSCDLGPVDYSRFERRTVEENLVVIDSAGSIYDALVGVAGIDAAAESARAFLITQPGVERAGIAADSTVWALFESGLLAGCGDDTLPSDSGGRQGLTTSSIRSGGEVGDFAHFVLPHTEGLPATEWSADSVEKILKRRLVGGNSEMIEDEDVTLGAALGAIRPGTAVLVWSGHGTLVWFQDGEPCVPGICLGESFLYRALADNAVSRWSQYFKPGQGELHQVAVKRNSRGRYRIVILPEFVRANGEFDGSEQLPTNESKTLVSLGTCFGGYNFDQRNSFPQAFRDAGADFVSAYDWAVTSWWAAQNDIIFFTAMADTCFPMEAVRWLGGSVDPIRHRGRYAQYRWVGDTLVLLRSVLDARKQGTLLRSSPGARAEMYVPQLTKYYCWVRQDGQFEEAAYVTVMFPTTEPGSFDLSSTSASLRWDDLGTGRSYSAQAGYIGTSGTLNVERCGDSLLVAHFDAKLGWWDAGKSPYVDPPDDTFSLCEGVLKYSGKITRYGLGTGH